MHSQQSAFGPFLLSRPRGRYTFICPLCRKTFKSDEPGEPCCTGPSESRDDHELTVMHLLCVGEREVDPALAERRAEGPLLMAREIEKPTPLIILP